MTPILYISFAVVATGLNLLSQAISFYIYDGWGSIYLAMSIGTLNGLILKYLLDKKYIFDYQAEGLKDDSVKFFLYSFMGIFTTAIFWFVELAFDYAFDHHLAKYAGAILGLSAGYLIKYQLDKKYVFIKADKAIENKSS